METEMKKLSESRESQKYPSILLMKSLFLIHFLKIIYTKLLICNWPI